LAAWAAVVACHTSAAADRTVAGIAAFCLLAVVAFAAAAVA